MDRRDYLMRMIEQMGAVLARLRQMLVGGEAVGEALRAEARRSGIDLDLARALDADSLAGLLSPGGQPDIAHLWVMAELLHLEGMRLDAEGGAEEEADDLHRKALRLYLTIHPAVLNSLPEAEARMRELEARLSADRV